MVKQRLDGGIVILKILSGFFIIILLIIVLLYICLVQDKAQENLNYVYTEKIYNKLKNKESFMLSEIFNFAFDEAYVIPELYSTQEYLLKKYNLTTEIELKDVVDNYSLKRILFLKNEVVIYDFLFPVEKIFTKQKDIVVFPDTKIIIADVNLDQDKCIYFSFEGNIVNGIIDRKYTEKILEKIMQNSEFLLTDIFEFEFDKAYMVSDIYDEEDLLNKYHLKTGVNIKDITTDQTNKRILFVKNDLVIYDYVYSINEIFTEQRNIVVFPKTKIIPILEKKGFVFEITQ